MLVWLENAYSRPLVGGFKYGGGKYFKSK